MKKDCQCLVNNKCMHVKAPESFWPGNYFLPSCILIESKDARIKTCAIQYPYRDADGKPLPPPMRLIKEGSLVEKLLPEERLLPSRDIDGKIKINE